MAQFQIVGGQLVDVQSGQVMTAQELENEMYLSALAQQQGHVGQMQIVGYMDSGHPVYAEDVGQLRPAINLTHRAAAARPLGGLQLSPALLQRLATARPPGPTPAGIQPVLRHESPGPVDLSPLGIDSQVTIAAGAVLVIPTVIQTIFRPERLSIGASVAPFFTITQLTLGNVPLTANTSEFAAETFADDAVGANLRKVTGQPGQSIFVGVRNEDANPRRFRATFFGASAQPEGCRT